MAKAINAPKPLPSQDELCLLLRYDPITGHLWWRLRTTNAGFTSERSRKVWNARYAEQPAIASVSKHGYLVGRINGELTKAHRVIWKMVTGRDPNPIDHINGVRSDNRWENLREVTVRENSQNTSRRSDNTSGAPGVYWFSRQTKWASRITVNGERLFLGYFDHLSEAIAVRKAAELRFGFHPNHGKP